MFQHHWMLHLSKVFVAKCFYILQHKKNPPTLSNFPLARKKTWARNLRHFFKQYNKRGKKKSIHYKHNLFCHKQMNNHHNHDNSTPASNVITSKQVFISTLDQQKTAKKCFRQSIGQSSCAHTAGKLFLCYNFFLLKLPPPVCYWHFNNQWTFPPSPTTRSRKSIIFSFKGNWMVSQSRSCNDTSPCSTSCIQYSYASNKLAVVKGTFLNSPSNVNIPSRRDSQ